MAIYSKKRHALNRIMLKNVFFYRFVLYNRLSNTIYVSYLSLIPFVAPVTTNTAATTHGLSTAAVTSDEDITTPTGESITAVEHTGGSSGEGRVKSLWDTVYLIKFICCLFCARFCAHKLLGLGGFISCLYPASSGLLQKHWGNGMIASVPVK